MIRVRLNGTVHYAETPADFEMNGSLHDPAQRARIAAEGVFIDEYGDPMDDEAQSRMRAFVARDDVLSGVSDRFAEDQSFNASSWLVPGLWRWGHAPLLVGQPKAGKTTLLTDLAASLVLPGRRFLSHFEPAELPMDAVVWMINGETPIDSLEEVLYDLGVYEGSTGEDRRKLRLEHLEAHGSPRIFDLTVRANFDLWATHFLECIDCGDSGDFQVPTVILVDGLTAILSGDTSRYAEWYSAFRELLRFVGIPNALVAGHATFKGDHAMGGTEAAAGPDGLWFFVAGTSEPRRFSVAPRMGGVAVEPTPVRLGDDGRLRVVVSNARPKRDKPSVTDPVQGQDSALDVAVEDRILEFVGRENLDQRGPKIDEIRDHLHLDIRRVRDAVKILIADGRLRIVERRGGRGQPAKHYYAGRDEQADRDTKVAK